VAGAKWCGVPEAPLRVSVLGRATLPAPFVIEKDTHMASDLVEQLASLIRDWDDIANNAKRKANVGDKAQDQLQAAFAYGVAFGVEMTCDDLTTVLPDALRGTVQVH
jgi:hypothetical protein